MKKFSDYLKMHDKKLKNVLKNSLNMISEDGFLYRKGTIPIMLVAHMDTVHPTPPNKICFEKGTMYSPQGIGGDDRCGIWMILNILKECDCYVVFTEEEEVGCIGARKFAKSKIAKEIAGSINYIIECDRRGSDDAVFYELDNQDFEDFILKEHWCKQYGTYTDICEIAPALGCAAVNLSCGYYKEHTKNEYIQLTEMSKNIKEIIKLIKRSDDTFYEYIEAVPSYYNKLFAYGCDDEKFVVCYDDPNTGEHKFQIVEGMSWLEAVGNFLFDYPDMTASYITGVYDEFFEMQYM